MVFWLNQHDCAYIPYCTPAVRKRDIIHFKRRIYFEHHYYRILQKVRIMFASSLLRDFDIFILRSDFICSGAVLSQNVTAGSMCLQLDDTPFLKRTQRVFSDPSFELTNIKLFSAVLVMRENNEFWFFEVLLLFHLPYDRENWSRMSLSLILR